MKFGSNKVRVDGPNKLQPIGRVKEITPGKQTLDTPSQMQGGVKKMKPIKPGKAHIISPADATSKPIR